MKRSMVIMLLLFGFSGLVIAQKLNVEGKMVIKDKNGIASFQSTSANAFIGLAPNENPAMSTNLGYYDASANEQYFFIDTPGGDFGEFRISNITGNVSIGSNSASSSAKLYVQDDFTSLRAGAPSFGPAGLRVTAYSSFGSGGGFVPNNGTAIEAVSWEGYGLYAESQDNIAVYGSGGFDSNTNTVQPDFWASRGIYGSDSSKRWKSDIKNIKDPLEKLAKLRGVTFKWDEKHGDYHTVGFIAEEVGKVLPEAVFYEANGVDARGMDYTKVIPLLVESANAMRKEYEEQFERQERAFAQQRQEVEMLKAMVERLLAREGFDEGGNSALELYPEAELQQNQPNPFYRETLIKYVVPAGTERARIQLTSADGKVLFQQQITQSGPGQISIQGNQYAAGTYFYSLLLNGRIHATKRMVLTE